MGNENVEFNEVRCKNLILGDEDTGLINLKVNKIDDSPFLEIEANDGNEDSSITIGFKDGKPILTLSTNKTNEDEHIITLYFDEEGMPITEMRVKDKEKKYGNQIALGLDSDGTPILALASEPEQDKSVLACLFITESAEAVLFLKNDKIKGGSIAIKADDDGGFISIGRNEDSTDETDSQKKSQGILLVNNSEITLMDIKGHTIGGKNIKEENKLSKGDNNE